jgi:seryl-tRNA synthetase
MEQQAEKPASADAPAVEVKKTPTVDELLAERERMAAALKEANREAADRRKRLDALESAEKARAEAAMSETEKAAAKAKELEAQLNATVAELTETKILTAIEREAVRLGFTDPSDAAVMIDRKLISIDGKSVTGVKEALETLSKAKPYLLKQTGGSVGSPSKPAQRTSGTTVTTPVTGYTTRI